MLSLTSLTVNGVPAAVGFSCPRRRSISKCRTKLQAAGSATITVSSGPRTTTLANVPLSGRDAWDFPRRGRLGHPSRAQLRTKTDRWPNANKTRERRRSAVYSTARDWARSAIPPATGLPASGALSNTLTVPNADGWWTIRHPSVLRDSPRALWDCIRVKLRGPVWDCPPGVQPVIVQSGFAVSNTATIVLK